MNTRLLVLLFSLLCASVQAATYQADTVAITHAKVTTLSGWSWKIFIFNAAGTKIGEASANNAAGTSVSASDLNGTSYAITQTSDFYLAWGAAYGGLYSTGSHSGNPDWIPYGWISAYLVGGTEPQVSATGGYVGSNAQNQDGSPADPITTIPTVRSYKAVVTLVCPVGLLDSKTFRVKGVDNNNVTIFDQVVTVLAGETRDVTVTADHPFNLTAQEVVENITYDPELSPGSPDDPDKRWKPFGPSQTLAAVPQTTAPMNGSQPDATNQRTAQSGSAAQPAAASTTMSTATTGATSKDLSDLSGNLKNEIQRGTEQTKQSGDAIKNSIGDSNKLLKDIKDGPDGDKGTGEDITAPSIGSLNFVSGIGGQATSLGSALSNLVNTLGLGANPGTAALSWNFSFPVVGTQYINLEPHADIIASIRAFLKWIMSILFLWQSFTVVRDAFTKS